MADEEALRDYLKWVTTDLYNTRQRLREVEERSHEPIAVVGIGCRYPGGVDTPEDFWNLLATARDGIADIPTDRGWDLAQLRVQDPDGSTRLPEGGFISDASGFDAAFFGTSPREAVAMDPQQRLLLEVAWEALERSGIDPHVLRGSQTGVFAGASLSGYGFGTDEDLDVHLMTGTSTSVISGRVSYALGLEGPAVTVDTACSSSLVALHLAAQSVRSGECSLALAGGVTVTTVPVMFTQFSKQLGLAGDGRCKAFSADADGMGISEGAGMVVLERLSDARRNGHPVLAVIRGSAINQDGASNGLAAPNGPSQQRVIRAALANARLSTADVDLVEAHGTGTTLGDPIEAQALLATYGQGRAEDQPVRLGSVKSNIGHTQAGAGIAGVIKLVLALQHQQMPQTLHAEQPSPHIDWSAGNIELLTQAHPWPQGERVRRGGVSSFGVSGTNAHVIVEEAPAEEPAEAQAGTDGEDRTDTAPQGTGSHTAEPLLPDSGAWLVSARTAEALSAQAGRLREWVSARPELSAADVAWSLAATRSAFEHRAVVLGTEREELLAAVADLAAGVPSSVVVSGVARSDVRVGLIFAGQGAQWAGMGRGLYAGSAVFAEAFDRVCELLERELGAGVRLRDVVLGAEGVDEGLADQTLYAQAGLFAFEVALAAVLKAAGVVPDAVVGHSVGEVAAAHVAGVLSLPDACALVAARARLMQELPSGGAMAAINAAEADVIASFDEVSGGVAVAAVNGPQSVVISGAAEAVDAVVELWRGRGRRVRRLRVSHAFHSPAMDPVLDELRTVAEGLEFRRPEVMWAGALTGDLVSDPQAGYWPAQTRQTVRFADAVATLAAEGISVFLEVGPDGSLSSLGPDAVAEMDGTEPAFVPLQRRTEDGATDLETGLARAFVHGVPVDWKRVLPSGEQVELPTYAFRHQRYWPKGMMALPGTVKPGAGDPAELGLEAVGHPMLRAVVELAGEDQLVCTGRLSVRTQAWLADHTVGGVTLLPGTGFVELVVSAGHQAGSPLLTELTLHEPLVLPAEGPGTQIQVVVGEGDEDGHRQVDVFARPDRSEEEHNWVRQATAVVAPARTPAPDAIRTPADLTAWPPRNARALDIDDLYTVQMADVYGPAQQGLQAVWQRGADIFAEVALPSDAGAADPYALHPVLLDAALLADRVAGQAQGRDTDDGPDRIRLPHAWSGVELHAAGASVLRVRLRRNPDDTLALTAADPTGAMVLSVDSVRTRPLSADELQSDDAWTRDALFTVEWLPLHRSGSPNSSQTPAPAPDGPWALIGADRFAVAEQLTAAGTPVRSYEGIAELVAAVGAGETVPSTVLACLSGTTTHSGPAETDAYGIAEAARQVTTEALTLAQDWLAAPELEAAKLVLVTRGSVPVQPGERVADPAAGAVWGLLRSAQMEHPDRFVLADLPADGSADDTAALPAALATGEPEVAVRQQSGYARRMVRPTVTDRTAPAPASAEAHPGTVLVTGGTGTLGGVVARHLAATGRAGETLLLSRSGPAAPGAAALAARIAAHGADVRVIACDAADRDALAGVLDTIPADRPLRSVVHTAGVIDDGLIGSLNAEQLAAVLRPKADAAWHLHDLTRHLDLDHFVLFSSVAAAFGGAGQGNYAAANAFLDTLAGHRRAAGLAGTALAWGPWMPEAGIGRDLDEVMLRRMTGSGLTALDEHQGLTLLDLALERTEALLVPARLNKAALRAQAAATGIPALWTELADDLAPRRAAVTSAAGASAAGTSHQLRAHLAAQLGPERDRLLLDLVRSHAAAVLGHPSGDAIEAGRPFTDLGFDSLIAVEFRNRLNAATGLRLPSTLVFDHPNPTALARLLHEQLTDDLPQGAAPAAPQAAFAYAADEPIAIVGMACRFPGGVTSPEQLWQMLADGTDGLSTFPTDRGWDLEALYDPDIEHAGTSYTQVGGFLQDAGAFDAGFFGISPREALAMDPQQRLLLETSWEALERAGIDPATLRSSRTGAFVGGYGSSYLAVSVTDEEELENLGAHLMTGNAASVLSGRVSYTLGLEGPAVTVDTACSSSLVALHLAAQALRTGECSLALAGGVTIMASPDGFLAFSHARGLAADGRSKAFSDQADGMGMAEGAGMLVVERLSDARRNGHPVLAVLRGSAINQDGASNGLTAPNGPSQQRVIRAALANSGLTTADIDVVEAHGTGTTLGDPIEAQALLATYGQDRGDRGSLLLGSVKSNIGHTQAAAGVAGVMKMVLALQHEKLPQTLYAEVPSSHVDWSAGEVRLLTEPVPWPSGGERVRRAGVSSFGISGTNAHVILEEAPAGEGVEAVGGAGDSGEPGEPVVPVAPVVAGAGAWVLSGRTAEALAAQAGRLREWVSLRPSLRPVDVAWSLAATRSVFEHRAVVVGGDREQVLAGLGGLVSGEPSGVLVAGTARSDVRPVFAFAGQGSQWVGMGRELAEVSPVFAGRLAECAAALAPYVDWSLSDVLAGAEGAPALEAADVVQPALWAVMVSLAAVWEAAGVVPEAVVGHSQGEIAAATVAGMLSLQDGARVVALRSRALKVLAGAGGMLSVSRPASEVEERLARFGERLSLAAVNGPSATVVSGEPEALEELKAEFEAEGARARMVAVDYASHSAQVDRLEEEITTVLAGISPRRGRVPMVSAMTGEMLSGEELDAGYWYRSLRATVHYDRAVRVLAGRGHQVFVEVTPHPVLMGAMNDTLMDLAQEAGPGAEPGAVCGTLRRYDGGADRLVASLAEAFVNGASVDWATVLPVGEQVELPTYAFRRRRYWPEGMLALPTGGSLATAGEVASTDAEAAFWAAVEGGDLSGLGDTLALEGGRPFNEVLPALASWRRRERDRSTTAGWRYRTGWSVIAEPDVRLLSGTWLVAVPAESAAELAQGCIGALSARGAEAVVVEVPAGTVDRAELAALLTGAADASAVSGVLSLLALDETPLLDRPVVNTGLAATLGLVQALGDAGVEAPLWVATRGAVAAGRGEALARPVQAQVWGLGRVVGLEYPERWGGLVDLPESLDERSGARLVAVLAGCDENEVAVRRAGILGRRLSSVPHSSSPEKGWTPHGTVLITGGTGAIAGHVARRLAGRGAERLVLTSRSGPAAEGAAALAAELAAAGSAVEIVACDVSERTGLTRLLDRIDASGPRLSSVLHTAAVLDDGVVDRLSVARLAPVLAVKAHAAALLDELTADLDLDAFVLFSSAASTLGGPGQGSYAAANSYLDALAENRRARGLPGLTVAWGLWGGAGLAQSNEAIRSRMRRTAMPPMDPQLAVEALIEAMDGPDAAVTVMDFDPQQVGAAPGTAHVLEMPLVRDMPEIRRLAAARADNGSTGPAFRADGELAARLSGLSRSEQDRILTDVVRAEAAAVLGHDSADEVQARQAFRDLGFDSLTSVELRNQLNAATGLRLPATLVFDHPTPVALAAFLHGELTGQVTQTAVAAPVSATPAADEPLAIVGMACRFPGGASSPEEFWELLASGGDAVGGFPTDRGWDLDGFFDPDRHGSGTSYTDSGAFLRGAAEFDAGFFGISPREALAMDPQQRLMLETSWEALERAGIDPSSLRGTPTGVFAGGFGSGYAIGMALTGQDGPGVEGHLMTGNSTSVLSGRVSYALGLEGPAVTVDTACSSSLVALNLAAQALRSGECSMALAGGVTVMATPFSFVEFSRQQGLSADGRCRAFSEDADGTGWAEGAGVLVVERLSDARRNGHRVLAVVRGTAVNQDGASNGLSAPNGPSQQRVIRAALANAGLSPSEVDAVEAHGTGTKLGDPIEAQALLATYGRDRGEGDPLWLGSVKSNIGHTQAAAGVAGVIKMVLALQHGQLPPTLHADEATSHVDWSAGEVRLLTEPVPWPVGERPRRAGISAFGISGTNAHVILEEAPAIEARSDSAGQEPGVALEGAGAWVVSGRTAEALSAQAGRLREWVSARPELRPVDVAWSLAATRSAFEHRAVVLGAERDTLLSGLHKLAAGASSPEVVSGEARPDVRVGLVFAGQGAQWAGMGRGLHAGSAVFAEAFDRVCGLLELELGTEVRLRDVILDGDGDGAAAELADQTLYAQAGLFAFEVALAEVLKAAGVMPDAVVGHSVGEVAAAHVAGVLSLPDACALVAARARLMQELPSGGAMAAINAAKADVIASLDEVSGEVAVAAVNGPESVVVSGAVDAVDAVVELWRDRGRRVRPLRVSHAFHSPAMDPVLDELRTVAEGLEFRRPEVMWAGALTGDLVSDPQAVYWPAQTRQTVRFADAVATLAREGVSVFLEVGPDGSLSSLGPDAVAGVDGAEAAFVALQRRDDAGAAGLLSGLARAFVSGAPVNWASVLPAGEQVELPTYAFRHQRYWPEGVLPLMPSAVATAAGAGTRAEAGFWAAVEGGDLARVAETLALEDAGQLGAVLPALASWRRRELDRSATADWRYRTVWSPVAEPDARVLTGTWVLLAPAGCAEELRHQCAAAVTARGAEAVVVEIPAGTVDRAELAALLTGAADASAVSGVLSLLALDEAPMPGYPVVPVGLAATLGLVQALGDAGIEAPLWIATRGAVAAGRGEVLARPVQAQVSGLGRVVALEYPERWGGLVDLPETFDERSGARLVAVLAGCGENEVALRPSGILGRRLAHASGRGSRQSWSSQGTVLVTGGTGAIAGHVSRWLVAQGAERLVLISRSGPAAVGVAAFAAELAAAGSAVEIVACDVSERAGLAGLLDRISASGPRLSSVMHTAGVLDDGVVDRLNTGRLETVLGVKAQGAVLLDELTAELDLDAFVLFSAAAATLGGSGQGNYAAANAFLDALAENRRARGLAGLAVAWGPWAGGGMAASSDAVRARVERGAMPPMDPQLAVRALAEALQGPDAAVAVMDVDWVQLASGPGAVELVKRPLVRDLPEIRDMAAAGDGSTTAVHVEGELARQLAGLERSEQERMLTDVVRGEAAVVLGYGSADAVEDRRAFKDLGFDSLTAVELRNRLNAATGLRLPSTLVFDYPTPLALAAFLRGELTGGEAGTAGAPAVTVVAAPADEPLAIVGMACRFPGGVGNPEEFWEFLASGGDGVGDFPSDRGWDLESVYDPEGEREGTSYVAQGAFLRDAAEFDAGFFGISPREALAMDPQQRLLLETSWEALERAGIDPASLKESATGVFAGGFTSGYGLGVSMSQDDSGAEGHVLTGNATSVLSGRVSYVLGLEGPAVTVDTACSSSLVALHLAAQAVRSGECSLALAGGATVMATPGTFIDFSRQQGLSADGRCRAFSEDADGTGWAEGAGMVVVERLSDARRNGHKVLAVLRGSAVNQDGASNGLTAPNGPSQQRVIRAALANARLTAAEVDVVEAHGTGTKLGDPIEAQALLATYGRDRGDRDALWLGSVKSNIGHTQAAAGVAGVIKMVLALQHEQLPRTLHAEAPSSHVDWSAGAVRLLNEQMAWPSDGDRVRRAAVSAFGMSGTNAHLILEEAPAAQDVEAVEEPGEPVVPVVTGASAWLLSGRTADALAAQAGRLREWTATRPELAPVDVAWSLTATRSVFEHRAVVVGTGRAELLGGVENLATGVPAGAVVSGMARSNARPVFAFAGQGSQWLGMGQELARTSPVFAGRLAECAGALAPYVDWSLSDVLAGAEDAPALEAADVVQPALWAVMVSLAAVWEAAGVAPEAVVGHSQGEIAAATVAGMLSLEDGARVVALRSRALKVLAGAGGMLSVSRPAAEVEERLVRFGERAALAAVNGPSATVVSGEPKALEELKADFEGEGARARMVAVDYASHSAQVDRLEEEITTVLAGISPRRGRVPMVSAMTGETLTGEELDAGYWYRSLRATVHYDRAVRVLAGRGHQVFVEVTPHPVLMGAMNDTLVDLAQETGGEPAAVCGTLRRDDGGAERLLTSLAEAFVSGAPVDWQAVLPAGEQVELPTYAFRRRRFWPEGMLVLPMPGSTTAGSTSAGAGASTDAEAAFWAAVEDGDLSGLGDALALEGERPFNEVLPALASWRRRERDRSTAAGWRYRTGWSAITEPDARVLSGTWLMVVAAGADGGAAQQCATALSARGAEAVVIEVPAETVDRSELAASLTGATADPSAISGVLSLLALDETPLPDRPVVNAGLAVTLSLVQALGDAEIEAPLWIATRGAVAAGRGEALARPVQAQVWGLGRVVALEHPERWGGLVDLPETFDERTGGRLVAVLAGCKENEVAIRTAGTLGRRMSRVPRRSPRTPWSPRGTVLVTGGTGAIAGHVSQWLAGRGAERLVLAGRSGPAAADVATRAAELATAGVHVDVISCDVSERGPLASLLGWIGSSGPELSSVMHTAGVLDDGVLDRLTTPRLESVLSVKAHGAALLDELTADLDLDAFVLFSSAASTLGGPGQGNYAAANAYLDALAENRRARGLAGLAVAWGLWGGGGLGESNEAIRSRMRRLPMPPMDPQLAVRALGESLDGPEPTVTVMDFDWQQLGSAPGSADELDLPLVRDIPEIRRLAAERAAAGSVSRSDSRGELAARLAGAGRSEQDRILTDVVRAEAAAVLGHDSADGVQARQAFKDLGFDSLTAVELRNRLNAATGLRLPATLVFDHPTPTALAGWLRTELAPEETAAVPLLAELDRLEAALRSGPMDDPVREEAAGRLRRLLDTIGEQAADQGRKRQTADIDAASDEELFALVDGLE
ncbi:type I polyketide synthase [Streptomyces chrestomyceticus]|uniref:type I polyketide synthase n=1 Tax=Streptomyces chrestomyceticus TaxID=68185 RepID=UPI0019CFF2F5|nr:type I polyketide synthase [Streptomyces chrestomyceticus]